MATRNTSRSYAQSYNQSVSDADYTKRYGNSADALRARLAAIFSNRGLSADDARLNRLADEVSGGRALDDIRKALDPFSKSTSVNRQQRAEGTLDLQEIRDALAAISGQFNLQRGQLEGQRETVNTSAQRALQALQRGEGEAITGFRNRAAGSGLLRSGLAVQDTGNITQGFARQRTQTTQDRAQTLRGIQGNLATLRSTETAARAARAREMARSQVGTKEAIARALKLV